jgi:hypothetical protein
MQDGVEYTHRELNIIRKKPSPDVMKNVHLAKKMFSGEIVN